MSFWLKTYGTCTPIGYHGYIDLYYLYMLVFNNNIIWILEDPDSAKVLKKYFFPETRLVGAPEICLGIIKLKTNAAWEWSMGMGHQSVEVHKRDIQELQELLQAFTPKVQVTNVWT